MFLKTGVKINQKLIEKGQKIFISKINKQMQWSYAYFVNHFGNKNLTKEFFYKDFQKRYGVKHISLNSFMDMTLKAEWLSANECFNSCVPTLEFYMNNCCKILEDLRNSGKEN